MSRTGPGIRGALLAFALLLTSPAPATTALVVSEPWIRATPPGAMAAAAYLVIHNAGAVDDRLLEARCDAATEVTMHVTSLVNGVLEMRDGALRVPAHASARLAPQGSHLMLMGLRRPLRAGASVRLTLRFEHAGSIEVEVPVHSATGAPP